MEATDTSMTQQGTATDLEVQSPKDKKREKKEKKKKRKKEKQETEGEESMVVESASEVIRLISVVQASTEKYSFILHYYAICGVYITEISAKRGEKEEEKKEGERSRNYIQLRAFMPSEERKTFKNKIM